MLPMDDAFVLEHLPDARDPGRHALHALHAELLSRPGDLPLAIQVARGEMQQCRKLFDPRACGRAEAALRRWISAENPPVEALLLRGVLRQTYHPKSGSWLIADPARIVGIFGDANQDQSHPDSPIG
jgi:hypothetical protein